MQTAVSLLVVYIKDRHPMLYQIGIENFYEILKKEMFIPFFSKKEAGKDVEMQAIIPKNQVGPVFKANRVHWHIYNQKASLHMMLLDKYYEKMLQGKERLINLNSVNNWVKSYEQGQL